MAPVAAAVRRRIPREDKSESKTAVHRSPPAAEGSEGRKAKGRTRPEIDDHGGFRIL